MVLYSLWLLAIAVSIECGILMVVSSIAVCGLSLWTVRSVTVDLIHSTVYSWTSLARTAAHIQNTILAVHI
jgi:hypothetical protein